MKLTADHEYMSVVEGVHGKVLTKSVKIKNKKTSEGENQFCSCCVQQLLSD